MNDIMEQKFKRGNLVKVLSGHKIWKTGEDGVKTYDIKPEYVGREAIIEGSYNEMYGNGEPKEKNSYSIIFMDNGNSLAWKNDNELELINEGGEHFFAEAKANREKASKEATDLKRIKETWAEKTVHQSSETILFLFEKIGHKSVFLRTGEFFTLHFDWMALYSLFDSVMRAETGAEIKDFLSEYYSDDLRKKAVTLFHEIHAL